MTDDLKKPRLLSVNVKLLSLTFAAILLVVIVQALLSIHYAQDRNEMDAEQRLEVVNNDFTSQVDQLSRTASALADGFANRADIRRYVNTQDRWSLLAELVPIATTLRTDYDAPSLNVLNADGSVFLRVDDPNIYGDTFVDDRHTLIDALETQEITTGVELDPNRIGVRGVAPMIQDGELIGLVEVGLDFNPTFLEKLKTRNDADYALWLTNAATEPLNWRTVEDATASPLSQIFRHTSTYDNYLPINEAVYRDVLADGTSRTAFITADGKELAVRLAPIKDYSGQTIGILEIVGSRAEALEALRNDQVRIVLASGMLLILLLVFIGVYTHLVVLRPLHHLTGVTERQAQGDLTARVEMLPRDEFGQLGNAFNGMTAQLRQTLTGLQENIAQLEEARVERETLIKDLQISKRLADENSRLKSEFLSTMSHELRTPMNAIAGFTSIMLRRMGGVEFNAITERYLNKVQSNSKRLLSLINDFLDLSRIESGRLELAELPIQLREMVQRWQDELSVLAEGKHLAFDIQIDPNLPDVVLGDEESLSKIATNLLGNAFKFTSEGYVSLCLDHHDGQMMIRVTDTGIGIPPHAREFIFDEFRQVDQSSKRKYGGTGLGLAIVQKLTRAMDGTITVESEVGKGSTFTVAIPIQTDKEVV